MKNLKKKSGTREKVLSGVVSLVLAGVIGIGGVTVYNRQKTGDNKNYINLNETDEYVNNTDDKSNNSNIKKDTADSLIDEEGDTANLKSPDRTGDADDEKKELAKAGDSIAETTDGIESGSISDDEQIKQDMDIAAVDNNSAVPINQTISYTFPEEKTLSWPVIGNIVLDYSMDKTVYFPTLKVYKCNPAVIISAEHGSSVCAAASGVVENIETLDETGITMTVNIGDGYTVKYGQLSEVTAGTGDVISKGQPIGTIATPTKYYKIEGDNLYFQLLKDNEPEDPVVYFE